MAEHRPRISSPYLVGRDAELARLDELLGSAEAGTATAALVTGAAGIGKSRLVEEVARRASERGFASVTGAGTQVIGGDIAFGPLVSVTGQLIRRIGRDRVAAMTGPMAPYLATLAPELAAAELPAAAPRHDATPMITAFCRLVTQAAARRPLLLVLEDLHWADRSTVAVLPWILRELESARTAVMITYRDDELPEASPTRRVVAEMLRAGLVIPVELRPLDRAQQAEQLAGILGVPPTREAVDRIHALAEGNPFYAEELVAGGASDLPEGLRDLLLTRLAPLPATTRSALQVVAAAGAPPSHRVVATASRSAFGIADADAALRAAVDHHLLRTELSGYGFRHELLRLAVASTLLPGEAARVHAALAAALESEPGASRGRAAAIAHHWHAAGEPRRAIGAALTAARAAVAQLGFAEALRHYRVVLAAWDQVDDAGVLVGSDHVTVLGEAAETAHLAGHAAEAIEILRTAAGEVDPTTDATRAGVLSERLGRYLWMAAEGREAMAAYERAVELVPPEPPTRERARVLAGLGQMLMLASRHDDAAAYCRQAREVARSVGARDLEGHAANSLGVTLAIRGEVDAGVALLREAGRLAEEASDDPDDAARAMVNLCSVLYLAGRWQEATEVVEDGITLVDELGLQRRKGVWTRCDAADLAIRCGRWQRAEELLDESLGLRPEGVDLVRVRFESGLLALRRGDLSRAEAELDAAAALGARIVDPQLVGPVAAARVDLASAQGTPERGLGLAETAWPALAEAGDAYGLELCVAATRAGAALAAATGDSTGMDRWAERCRAVTASVVAPGPIVDVLAVAAGAEAGGVGPGSDDGWQAAVAGWRGLGDPYLTAYSLMRLSEARSAAPGGHGAAVEAAAEARTIAAELGAAGVVAEVDDLVRRAGLDMTVSEERDLPEAPYGLTPREQEILALLADGWSNRRIGAELFISPRTVEVHVSNLLAKLDASNRAEAGALAHREGLTRRRSPAGS